MKKSIKSLIVLGIILMLGLIFTGWWEFGGKDNLHAVIPGQIYRSGELSQATLQHLVVIKQIKTIINLEGSSDGRWYQDEMAVSKRNSLHHYDMELSAHRLPSISQLRYLVHLLQTAPRPILIHCHRGADRSGLAAAIAIILANDPLPEAQKQYSWRYRALSPTSVGKLVIPLYQKWLTERQLPSTARNFDKWVKQLQPGAGYPVREQP